MIGVKRQENICDLFFKLNEKNKNLENYGYRCLKFFFFSSRTDFWFKLSEIRMGYLILLSLNSKLMENDI